MPMTDYSTYPDRFVAGQVANTGCCERRTRLNVSGDVIGFGCAVVQSPTVEDGALLPSSTNTNILGVAERKYMHENAYFSAAQYLGYPDDVDFNIVREGDVVVYVEEAISLGDAVYCRHTANGAGKLYKGQFRNDADTSNCFQITNAKWLTATTGAGLAVLSLNLA